MRRFHVRWPVRALRSLRLLVPAALALLLVPALALAAVNGKLQIHHVNVGQADGILLISPLGETALFDDGNYLDCSGIKTYLQGQGLTSIKYHFTTHYHADHIGCIDDLAAIGITVGTAGYDRGGSYSSATYTAYVNTLGAKRMTIAKNQVITLDAGAANPVLIKCVDLNGAGVYSGTDENSLSTVYKVTYGAFDEALGGDLPSVVEAAVGVEMGDVEVYKIHHHGSATSTSAGWLSATTPEVGILSVGTGNSYGHPTATALTNLHNAGVKTYWTQTGSGVAPNATWDKVGGTIIVQADPGVGAAYTVAGTGFTDTYYNGSGGTPPSSDTKVASAVTMINGTVTSGTVANLAANDASRMTLTSAKSGTTYLTNWYGSATLAYTPTNLTVTYDGNYSVSRTQVLYIYNFTTAAWTQINSGTVSTSDVTKTWTTTTPAAYVSSTREVRLRVAANTRTSSYTCRPDYMAFSYQYATGLVATQFATELSQTPPEAQATQVDQAPAGDEIALAAAPNPLFHSTRFSFTLSRAADVQLEIFDLNGRRVATPFSGHAAPGTNSAEWSLRTGGGSPVPAGIYFARLTGLGQTAVTRLVVLGR
jgi:beta-lactamase superfamily II metal-dependent hydrolase